MYSHSRAFRASWRFLTAADLYRPRVTRSGPLTAASAAAPAIEAVDRWIVDRRIALSDTGAENVSSRLLTVGACLEELVRTNLRAITLEIAANGQPIVAEQGNAFRGPRRLSRGWTTGCALSAS